MMKSIARTFITLLPIGSFVAVGFARPSSSELTRTLARIFNEHEFNTKHFGPARWIEKGDAYTAVEPSSDFPQVNPEKDNAPKDIVRYETASGSRTVMVRASQLVPTPGAKSPAGG